MNAELSRRAGIAAEHLNMDVRQRIAFARRVDAAETFADLSSIDKALIEKAEKMGK